MKVLKKIDDIGFCQLTSKDVVRHPLVQQIVQAYDAVSYTHLLLSLYLPVWIPGQFWI